MTDPSVLAAWLLISGPVVGLVPVAHPALVPIWSMPREAFVATVVDALRIAVMRAPCSDAVDSSSAR